MMSDIVKIVEPLLATGQQLIAEYIDAEVVHHESWGIHDFLQQASEIIVAVIDIMTVVVILYGFLFAIYLFVKMHMDNLFGEKHTSVDLSVIRVKLWSYLLLALELFIASDIILTIGDPSIAHLIQLAAIVVIRIVISHFLQQEMSELTEGWVHH